MVEVVNGFGSGVAGLLVLTHTHTPPARGSHALPILGGVLTILLFITHADILPLSPRLGKNAHTLAIRVPSIAVHSHAEGFFPVFRLHAPDFAGFTHPIVFFCGFVNSEAVSFTHELIRGFCILVVHASVVRL